MIRQLAEVSLARVGLVVSLDASRLARNSSDWHRLVELCGLFGTLIADGERHCAVDGVLQFAHVAGPWIGLERGQGGCGQRTNGHAVVLGAGAGEVGGEQFDVTRTLTERRQNEWNHSQPVIQVFAEQAFRHAGFQIPMCRSDDAHIHPLR